MLTLSYVAEEALWENGGSFPISRFSSGEFPRTPWPRRVVTSYITNMTACEQLNGKLNSHIHLLKKTSGTIDSNTRGPADLNAEIQPSTLAEPGCFGRLHC